MCSKVIAFFLLLVGAWTVHGQNFVQRQGKKVYYQGNEILLRGMAFGNLVWEDAYANTPNKHHSEIDYQRLQDLGMNAIRFYMNYKTFENDANPYNYKQNGWDWIDLNIKWAKAHNIFLILNMHIPQGGFQSQCKGSALWTDTANQNRLVALWKAIAHKYKDEPQIAGFDLVNEPTPSGSIENWTNLAQRIIDGIRTVDNNHMIITERALALGCDYSYTDANSNYPQITESNLMYTVHMYDPYEFTHQNLAWAGTGDGGKYPDNDKITVPTDASYATGDYDNPSIGSGTSDWKEYKGSPFSVTVDTLLCGRVVFLSNKIATGMVYFDDFVLNELDASNNIVKTIHAVNLTSGTQWYWSANNTGTNSSSTSGHGDSFSVTVTGNTSNATVILPDFAFRVEKGKKYAINGWMKGDNIPTGATASIATEYYYSPSHKPLSARNYQYLVGQITNYTKYIEAKGFPVYFGEFGAGRPCFVNNKGGGQWVADCMRIFDSLGYHFTYHSYKETSFGYYDGWDQPVNPNTVNTDLEAVFKTFFGGANNVQDLTSPDAIGLQIQPNPVGDLLKINLGDGHKLDIATIIDVNGRKVVESTTTEINVQQLKPGIYYLRVVTKGKNVSSKFVKK